MFLTMLFSSGLRFSIILYYERNQILKKIYKSIILLKKVLEIII